MPVEIERKFLVETVPSSLGQCAGSKLVQGFLADTPNEVRLRNCDDVDYLLTVKGGNGMMRTEVETPISREQFDVLWPMTEGRRIQKVRYQLTQGDHTYFIDRFHGANEGLVIVEVEFADEQSCHKFIPEAWFGDEITGNTDYYNNRLAT